MQQVSARSGFPPMRFASSEQRAASDQKWSPPQTAWEVLHQSQWCVLHVKCIGEKQTCTAYCILLAHCTYVILPLKTWKQPYKEHARNISCFLFSSYAEVPSCHEMIVRLSLHQCKIPKRFQELYSCSSNWSLARCEECRVSLLAEGFWGPLPGRFGFLNIANATAHRLDPWLASVLDKLFSLVK